MSACVSQSVGGTINCVEQEKLQYTDFVRCVPTEAKKSFNIAHMLLRHVQIVTCKCNHEGAMSIVFDAVFAQVAMNHATVE